MANVTQKLTLQVNGQDKTKATFAGINDRVNSLGKSGSVAGGAISGAFKAAGVAAAALAAKIGVDLLKNMQLAGEQARQVGMAFDAAFGAQSTEALARFQQASQGVLDATSLQQTANSLSLVGFSIDEIASATDAALRVSILKGKEFNAVYQQLAQALATGRSASLQSLGVVIDQAAAQELYAKSIGKTVGELSALEKKQATLAAVTEQVTTSGAGGIDTAAAIRANQRLRTELANMWSDMTERAAAVGDLIAAPLLAALDTQRRVAAWVEGSGEETLKSAEKLVIEHAKLADADTFRQFEQFNGAIREMQRLVEAGLAPTISNFGRETKRDLRNMNADWSTTVQLVGALEEKMVENRLVSRSERSAMFERLKVNAQMLRSQVIGEQAAAEAAAKQQAALEQTITFRAKAAEQEAQALSKWWSTREQIAKLERVAEGERSTATEARLRALRLNLELQEEETVSVRGLEAEFQRLQQASDKVPDPETVEQYNGAVTRTIGLIAGLREQLIANGLQMKTLNELEAAQMRFELRRQQIMAGTETAAEKAILVAQEGLKLAAEKNRLESEAAQRAKDGASRADSEARANAARRRQEAEARAQRLQGLRDREQDLAISIQRELGLLNQEEQNYAEHQLALSRLDRERMSDKEYAIRERILLDEYALKETQRLNQERIDEERRQMEQQRELERQALEERREAARRQMELDRAIAAQRRENALQAAAALQVAAQGINAQVGAMASAFVQAQTAQEGYAEAEKQGAAAAQAAAPGLISAYGAVAGSVITNVKVMSIVRGLFEAAAAIASAAVGDLRGAALHGAASAAFFVAAGQAKSQGKSLAASTTAAAGSAQVASQAAQPAQSQNITINYQESGFRVGTMQELGAGVARVLNYASTQGVRLNGKLIAAQGGRGG